MLRDKEQKGREGWKVLTIHDQSNKIEHRK